MSRWSLHFDSPDLAGWLWVAVWSLAALELFHYLWRGRRPARPIGRWTVGGAIVALLIAAQASGELRRVHADAPLATGLLGLLLVPRLIRAYRDTHRSLRGGVRGVLLGCRLLALGVVLVLLARPVLEYVTVTRERGTLAIVLDNSRSMGVRDVIRPQEASDPSAAVTRLEAVTRFFDEHRDELTALADEVDLRYFTFDSQVNEVSGPILAGDGGQTALAAAIRQVRNLLAPAGGKPSGILVISDGRDNASAEDEQRVAGEGLAAEGIPLYAVGVGSELPAGQNRSLLARRLDCPESVAVLNRLPVRAEFVAAGLAGVPVNVELLWDDMIVDAKTASAEGAQEMLRVEFEHRPVAGGLHRVAVRGQAAGLASRADESTLSQFVRVTDEKIQVLYLDRPRYERAAIARALEAAPELRLTKLDLAGARADAASPSLPGTSAEWQAYHVILIGDADRTAFADSTLAFIAELVRDQGRGVGMLGGVRTLGTGRFVDSPLAGLIPVSLGASGQLPGPLRVELTAAGRQHPILRVAADAGAVADRWDRLPPLDGAARLAAPAPTAEVLAQTAAGDPLVVVSEAGRGRAAVVAFDSSWRWPFAADEGLEVQRRFWRQLAIWLANRRPEVWVAADQPRYDRTRLGTGVERVTLRAGVSDPTTGRTPEGAVLRGTVTGPDGTPVPLQWIRVGEGLEARPAVREPGEYRVRVAAQAGTRHLGDSEAAFVIASRDPELADPTADLENLRRMAEQTRAAGGMFLTLEVLGPLVDRLQAMRHATEIRHTRRDNIVDDRPWSWLGVLMVLLTAEWVIRRRVGLV